jgi:succinate-semialdehyde dehydrogenase/glutarate-semialdehyde dehydrogenase
VLGKVASCDLDDFKKAIASADKAQKEYFFGTTAAQRGVILRKWFDLIMDNLEDRMRLTPSPEP